MTASSVQIFPEEGSFMQTMELVKPTRLNASNARRFRKRTLVYAFRSLDAVTCHKIWGTSEGQAGDWIIINDPKGVPSGEDVYTCAHEVFLKTYEPASSTLPHVYRKTGHIWAAKMMKPFTVVTLEGLCRGNASDFLAQNSIDSMAEQWCISKDVFDKTYEIIPQNPGAELISHSTPSLDFGRSGSP
mmetsp:Transcript_10145/g.16629  ORF Transcript_10145/g.16629 Transcript_10145/m.16629 type:complete len:187 (-) Transcript_10145:339-899(-)